MFKEEYMKLANLGLAKINLLHKNPLGYLMMSMLAGAYMSFGVFLVFTAGGLLNGSPAAKLVMGASFAVALSLVVMAGGELFTGNNLCTAAGIAKKQISFADATRLSLACWLGNLAGSVLFSWLFSLTGLYSGGTLTAVTDSAAMKMTAGFVPLLSRGILCNILVCLAVWCATKLNSEAGKLMMVFWCIFAFFATGFEHSIANMTTLTLALIDSAGNEAISLGGYFYNLFVVTLGNMIGGCIFVAVPYYVVSREKDE